MIVSPASAHASPSPSTNTPVLTIAIAPFCSNTVTVGSSVGSPLVVPSPFSVSTVSGSGIGLPSVSVPVSAVSATVSGPSGESPRAVAMFST